MDELRVGEDCTVTDLRTGTSHRGIITYLEPDATGGPDSKVQVTYDDGRRVRVGPGFVTLIGDEA